MPTKPHPPYRQKLLLILGLCVTTMVIVWWLPPIPQDPAYHDFADQRMLLGIPHFWNTLSNLAFLVIGGLGVWQVMTAPLPGGLPELRTGYLVFFLGVALIAGGSGYYHLHPTNERLVWDRLPIIISLMAFFAVIVGERIAVTAGRRWLWPLLAMGIAAVVYWAMTEARGFGDLRPYAVAQFLPLLLIPIILVLFPSRFSGEGYLWATLLAYAVAKAGEMQDEVVWHFLGVISGHTLKHLVAAGGAGLFLLALRRRSRITR
jgi:hypothetical protein